MDVMIHINARALAQHRWPEDTEAHRLAREAFVEGAATVAVATQHLDLMRTRLDFLIEIARQSVTGMTIEHKSEVGWRVLWHHHIGHFKRTADEAIDDAADFFSKLNGQGAIK